MDEPASLGAIVRERRLALGYSLGQLATKVGRTAASIRAWERGDTLPTVDEAEALAAALDLDHVQLAAMAVAQSAIDATESAAEDAAPAAGSAAEPAGSEPASKFSEDAGSEDADSEDADSVDDEPADEEPNTDSDDALHAAVVGGAASNNPWRARSVPTAGSEIEWTEGALSDAELADEASTAVAGAPGHPEPAIAAAAIHEAKTEAVPVVVPTSAAVAVAEPEVAVTAAVDTTAPVPVRNTNPLLAAWDDAVAWYREVFDPNKKWIYRVRYVLMAIVLYILLRVLGWAAGELWDAIGAALDSISFSPSDTPDISS